VADLDGGGRLYRLLRHGHQSIDAFVKTLQHLQKAGAMPKLRVDISNPMNDWRETVLFRAITDSDNVECMRLLLDSGWGQEKEISWTFMTHLHRAIAYGNYDLFVLLIERGFNLFEKVNHFDTGPECDAYLFCALAQRPNVRIVEKLHSLGVPYHESSTISPFETAVRRGFFNIATFFATKCGADIDRFVKTPASAESLGPFGIPHLTLLGSLISEYSPRSISSIRFLLEGFSLPATDGNSGPKHIKPSFVVCEGDDQVTALHLAAGFTEQTYEHISPFLLSLLLSAYPGPEHIDSKDGFFEWTALWHYVKCGNYEAVRVLLENGARHNILDNGASPLDLARSRLKDLPPPGSKGRGGKSHIEDMRMRFNRIISLLEEAASKDKIEA
jgi:hypothetical protein